jgi:hypothetical protein
MNTNFPFLPAPRDPVQKMNTEFLTRRYEKWDIFRVYQSLLYTYIECESSNTHHRQLLRISRFPMSLFDLEIESISESILLDTATIINPLAPPHSPSPLHSGHNGQNGLASPRKNGIGSGGGNQPITPRGSNNGTITHHFQFRTTANETNTLKLQQKVGGKDISGDLTQQQQQQQSLPTSSTTTNPPPLQNQRSAQSTSTITRISASGISGKSIGLGEMTGFVDMNKIRQSDPSLPTLQLIATGVGLLGFVRFELGFYLQLIVSADEVGKVGNHQIYSIESVRLIQLYSPDCVFSTDTVTNPSQIPQFLQRSTGSSGQVGSGVGSGSGGPGWWGDDGWQGTS